MTSQGKKKLIMFSYNHDDSKEMANKIYDKLPIKKSNLWLDEYDLHGEMLEGMAEAVENSYIVLIFVSPKYETSKNCKSEATYAKECNKHVIPIRVQAGYEPKGWLGMLTSSKRYIDFSKGSFNDNFNQLLAEIDHVDSNILKLSKDESREQTDDVNGDKAETPTGFVPNHPRSYKLIRDAFESLHIPKSFQIRFEKVMQELLENDVNNKGETPPTTPTTKSGENTRKSSRESLRFSKLFIGENPIDPIPKNQSSFLSSIREALPLSKQKSAEELPEKTQDGASENAKMAEMLACPVCLGILRKPVRMLSCGHNLCHNCLTQLCDNSSLDKRSSQCPLCRESIHLGSKGVESIARNFTVENMIDGFKLTNQSPDKIHATAPSDAQTSSQTLKAMTDLALLHMKESKFDAAANIWRSLSNKVDGEDKMKCMKSLSKCLIDENQMQNKEVRSTAF